MNKTPVSILQELMVKKGTVPNYELIHDGGGSHVNTFTFQVSCDGFLATGTGRCKKDAKHEAAKAMLETIAAHRAYPQLPASPAESPVRTPLPPKMPISPRIPPDAPFVNAIGALQDLCAENNLQEPRYDHISEVGPPHAKIFTYHCIVSTFKEEGVATTKKQAKQEAARKMLDRIRDLIGDVASDDDSVLKDNCKKQDLDNEIAKARYPQLTKVPSQKKVNLGLKMSEYHLQLKRTFDKTVRNDVINQLDALTSEDYTETTESVDKLISELEKILSILKLEFSTMWLTLNNDNEDLPEREQKEEDNNSSNKDDDDSEVNDNEKNNTELKENDELKSKKIENPTNLFAFLIKIDFSPTICEIGIGSSRIEAQLKAITNLVNTLTVFLQ